MINKIFLIIPVLIVLLLIISSNEVNPYHLAIGKNNIVFNNIDSFYVMDLIKLNPDIETISYYEDNKSIGYVNVFGGIGENFVVVNDIRYEIILSKDIDMILPKV